MESGAAQRVQRGRVRAKHGLKTKACLQVTLKKAMCATKRCMGLVTGLSLLEGLGACKVGIECQFLLMAMTSFWVSSAATPQFQPCSDSLSLFSGSFRSPSQASA